MKQPGKLRLVKAYRDDRVVLFWESGLGEQQSPNFASLPLAEEWWLAFHHAAYTGAERRQSVIDRRRLGSRTYQSDQISHFPDGRRASDRKVLSVDVDRTHQDASWFIELLTKRRLHEYAQPSMG